MVYPTSFSRLEHGDSQVTRLPSTPTFLGTAVILYSVLEMMRLIKLIMITIRIVILMMRLIKLIIITIRIIILMMLMTSMIIIMILSITNNQKIIITIIMILYYNDDNDTVLSPINWTEPTTPQTFQTRLTFKCSKAFVWHNQFFFVSWNINI